MTKTKTTVTPLGFNVLVEIVEFENKTKGGIIIPNNDENQIRSELVKIISYGESAFTDCFGVKNIPSIDQPYALIQKNAGQPFYLYETQSNGGKPHRLVQSDHILGAMNEEEAIAYCRNNFNFEFKPNKKSND